MGNILEKLKLKTQFVTEIDIRQSDFSSALRKRVDDGGFGIFADFGDLFSSSRNEYKGSVETDGFKIKRKKRMFEMRINSAVATGQLSQNNETLVIETEINGFSGFFEVFFILGIIGYSVFLAAIFLFVLTNSEAMASPDWWLVFFVPIPLFFHAALILGIPYFFLKREVGQMKHELEREYFFTKK